MGPIPIRLLHLQASLLLVLTACAPQPVLQSAGPGGEPAAVERIFLVTDRELSDAPERRGARADAVSRAVIDVGIPPVHAPGQVEFATGTPDPARHFAVLRTEAIQSEAALLRAVASAPNPQADVVVYVHGYNTTLGAAVYRHAQMAYDFGTEGPQVTFSWPSAAEPLGYVRDRDSIDIARDDLEDLLLGLARGNRRILLVGHSMGSQLITETLRQMSIGGEGWALARLSAVALLSPDIDMDVFRSQVGRIDPLPQPFVVLVSQRDRVLGLSARLVGQRERLGSTSDIALLRSLGVSVVDLTSLSGQGSDGHLLAATSPTAITVLRGLEQIDPDFGQDGPTVIDVADVLLEGVVAPVLASPTTP